MPLQNRIKPCGLPDIEQGIVESGPPIGSLGGGSVGVGWPVFKSAEEFDASRRVSVHSGGFSHRGLTLGPDAKAPKVVLDPTQIVCCELALIG